MKIGNRPMAQIGTEVLPIALIALYPVFATVIVTLLTL